VNVSIGGVLTPYAAPPVIMVAGKWGWNMGFMLQTFGYKAVIAVMVNSLMALWLSRKELVSFQSNERKGGQDSSGIPIWITVIHLAFIAMIVVNAHHMTIFIGLFLFFLGVVTITREYQDELKLREGLLVGFFLGGLVVLGGPQSWWLKEILPRLGQTELFLASTGLTAIFDNAALTYLGSQVPSLSDALKYSLVAGAVAGGGLTVIANAPNPAGFGILSPTFENGAISPIKLLIYAAVPTLVAVSALWFLP
jgi:hypothetical protein